MIIEAAIRNEAVRLAPPSCTIPPLAGAPAHLAFGEVHKAGSLDQIMQLTGAVVSYPRNAEVFGEDEAAEYIYKVVSGGVRTYKILDDGRRQVGAFHLPGDIFGLEDSVRHALSAEAMTGAKVLVVKRSAINALVSRDASIAQELFVLTSRQLRRMQQRVLLLAKSAQERVASFLVEMAERSPASNIIELPMSRQDIADYLGLTIETVSRTLTCLQCAAVIELPAARRIVLRDRLALSQMNG